MSEEEKQVVEQEKKEEVRPSFGPPRREEVIPQDWKPTDPLFMEELSDNSDALAALQSLADDQTPEERFATYKENGNDSFAWGNKRGYEEAIAWYTKALEEKVNNNEANSIVYSNRAMVNLKLENFGKVVEDCKKSIELNEKNVKSYYRGAQAYLSLKKYENAIEFCETALSIEKDNKAVMKIKKEAEQKLQRQREIDNKKQQEQEKIYHLESSLRDALSARKVIMGKPLFKYTNQQYDGELRWLDESHTELSWPVLFLYPEHSQSDFIQSFGEFDSINEHLEIMFPENEFAMWDTNRNYVAKNLSVYFQSNSTDVLGGGKNYKKQKWVRIDPSLPLLQVLQMESHIIPKFPVFHVFIRNSDFEKEFLLKSTD